MNKKIKILYFDLQLPYLLIGSEKSVGGAAVEWLTWLKAFNKIGCDSALLTWQGAKEQIKNNVEFEIIESYNLNKGIPKLRFLTYQLPMLILSIKKFNPDYIIQECANRFTGILALVTKLLGKPFIHRIASDMDVDERIKKNISKFYLYLYYSGLKNTDFISCQNNYQLNILKNKFPQKPIYLHYNPFEIKTKYLQNTVREYIAWIGNFRYEKNLPALAIIAKKLKQYKFKIVGKVLDSENLDTQIGLEELEKLNNVEFLGHVNNSVIPEFLSRAYCLLNTSRLEGFSNTFLEAWSVGIPVISTKNVNPDSIITKFNLGIVAETYEEIPEILNNFISQEQHLKYYENCINYVKKNHDPESIAKKFIIDLKNIKKVN
jgi:glycosyltransferase involved in cell wall biosynthesis